MWGITYFGASTFGANFWGSSTVPPITGPDYFGLSYFGVNEFGGYWQSSGGGPTVFGLLPLDPYSTVALPVSSDPDLDPYSTIVTHA